jgi:hypothetical protein
MTKVHSLLASMAQMTIGDGRDEEICLCDERPFDSSFESPPMVPCCHPCPHCQRNIKRHLHANHVVRCLQERQKSEEFVHDDISHVDDGTTRDGISSLG